jgi:uroporphyrin-III C-methyltransferase / precorrin-2 dehydrogenase / sirohydrochlorin ferrochelatase
MSISRQPSERPAARMEPLSRLPVFFALEGRRAVVAGGNAGAAWKAELLSAAGATVDVFAADVSEEMAALAARSDSPLPKGEVDRASEAKRGRVRGYDLLGNHKAPSPGSLRSPTSPQRGEVGAEQEADAEQEREPRGTVVLHPRPWRTQDLAGAAMAVGAFETDAAAERFANAARAAGVPVNVVDRPAFCDFSFGAIVNRSPLVIGISTDGAAPVFAQAIRAKLEAFLPAGFAAWAQAAQGWRARLKDLRLSFAGRRRFWQAFTAYALRHPGLKPTKAQFDRFASEVRDEGAAIDAGSVTLVGAGPGDPELLTLRAVRALQSADVILFDDLVAPVILDFARREARKMLVGKTGYAPSCRQDDINRMMVSLAKAGKRVVRLKGGDPMIFGRAGEEIAACRAAGLAVEVVPGITAAQGAASRLGASLTHRREAQRVQYLTGHAQDGALPDAFDWQSLAHPSVTTVIYMPTRTLAELASRAMAAGLDPSTPAIAVARATRSDETVIAATIADIAERVATAAPRGPLIVLIGRVLAQGGKAAATRAEHGAGPKKRRRAATAA